MRAAALSDFAGGARALEASPTVLRRCPAVADGRAARGYKRGCSGMFPGPSRQTPREPDLGNPYRVDLGTAMFGWNAHNNDDDNHYDQLEKKQRSWIGRAAQKHDDNTMHDAHAKHDAHTDNTIAAMEAEHNKSIAANPIDEQNVRETETRLREYGNQLERVKNTQEEKKNAEITRRAAEDLKRKSEIDIKAAHMKMEEELARLQKLKPGTASRQTTNPSNVSSRK